MLVTVAPGAVAATTDDAALQARASRDVTALGRQAAHVATTVADVPGPLPPRSSRASSASLVDPRGATAREAGLELISDYLDVCADGGGIDLRRVGVFVDREDERAGFDVIGCAGEGPSLDDVRLTWLVDLDLDGRADRAVVVSGRDQSGTALSRPDDAEAPGQEPGDAAIDLSDWSVLWRDSVGMRVDSRGRLRVTVLMPDNVFAGVDGFDLVVVSSALSGGTVLDRLPEAHEPALHHPVDCSDEAAVVQVAAGATADVRSALTGRGFTATGTGSLLRVQPATPADRALLAATPGVVDVRAPRTYQLTALPQDPYIDEWALTSMRAEAAYTQRPGLPTRIAILDDGIDTRRADLRDRVVAGWDAVNARPLAAGVSSDRGGHGTAVAGVAGATRDNGLGVAGVNPLAHLVPVRVSDAAGCIDDASLVEALGWVAREGVDVANLSLGGPEESDELARAISDLASTGTIIVAASGNDPNLEVFYPGAYDDVISVGALAPDDQVATYSTGGPWLDVVAPGGAAYAGDDGLSVMSEDGTLRSTSGTSFAAPQVAGALSVWVGRSGGRPGFARAMAALAASARDVGQDGWDERSGAGALDLAALYDLGLPLATDLPGFDGDPSTVDRFVTADPVTTAVAMSRLRFADHTASHVVLVAVDRPVDAVAASPLLGGGPLLLTGPQEVPADVAAEVERAAGGSAVVYLVGGSAALPEAIADQLRGLGHVPRRLAGEGRVATSVAVADEVVARHGEPSQVLVAHAGFGQEVQPWPDAIAAAAWSALTHTPLLLSDRERLSDPAAEWLAARPNVQRVALGGPGALAEEVLASLDNGVAGVRRVHGDDRAGTAAAVAGDLFRTPVNGWRWFTVVNGREPAGWVSGMLAAGLAADLRAPMLLVEDASVPPATLSWAGGCADRPVELLVVGSESLVSRDLAAELGHNATNC